MKIRLDLINELGEAYCKQCEEPLYYGEYKLCRHCEHDKIEAKKDRAYEEAKERRLENYED